VRALIGGADVVVNNFRAGVMERMGLGYEDCRKLNARVIYAVGTGFGETGPYSHKGGQDVLAQAMSGVMMRRMDTSHPLSIYPTTFADYSAGMHLVQGILLALLHRQRTGEGQKVSVALYNSMLAAQMQEAAMLMNADTEINWAAMPLTGVFETKDGAVVVVGAFKPNPLRDICAALDIPDMSGDSRFATLTAQIEHKPLLQSIFRERYKTQTTAYWLDRLEAQDLLCAPVRSLREALADAQTHHNGMVIEAHDGDQTLKLVGSPIRMSAAPVAVRNPPPRLGEHTEEVLAEAGVRT
jgi:formyl-CoA transferase